MKGKTLNVLVACEYSGLVRDAFARLGHNALSCDLLPTEREGQHYQGNIFDILYSGKFDIMIGHPPCTRICNSGVRWLNERDLWDEMEEAAIFFRYLLEAPIPHKAIENPIPHKYAVDIIGRNYDQKIQPWMFGHGETKATCLWLDNLPKLTPTDIVDGREQRIWKMPPGTDRGKERSKTYPGIAAAMAAQWSEYVLNQL